MAVYTLSFLVYAQVTWPKNVSHHTLVYLTIQGYLVVVCYQVFSAIVVAIASVNCAKRNHVARPQTSPSSDADNSAASQNVEVGAVSPNDDGEAKNPDAFVAGQTKQVASLPWYFKLRWFLFNVSALVSVTITVCYYGFIFRGREYARVHASAEAFFKSLNFHGFTSVFVLSDLAISAIPLRILHGVYGMMALIAYAIFTLIYWAADHDNVVYPILNWNQPATTLMFIALTVVCTIVVWLAMFGLYKLRIWLAHRCA